MSITNRCNFACGYCPISKWRNNPEFINDATFESCVFALEMLKPDMVEVTGGEPTLVPWLNDLCNYMESKGVFFLVKSNGTNKCKNQVSAWHKDICHPPNHYDWILIIQGTPGWKEKQKYCQDNKLPHKMIGLDKDTLGAGHHRKAKILFMCPSGHFMRCHATPATQDLEGFAIHVEQLGYLPASWDLRCEFCKSVNDFFMFAEGK